MSSLELNAVAKSGSLTVDGQSQKMVYVFSIDILSYSVMMDQAHLLELLFGKIMARKTLTASRNHTSKFSFAQLLMLRIHINCASKASVHVNNIINQLFKSNDTRGRRDRHFRENIYENMGRRKRVL